MTVVRLVFQQHAAPAAPAVPAPPARTDLGEEIRQATQAALEGTRAAQSATGTGGEIRITRNGQTTVISRPGVYAPEAPAIATTVPPDDVIPHGAVEMAWGLFAMLAVMVVGWPIARAFGRRIERRGEAALPNAALASQLVRIEQAVEAMAIEVERISESQRFIAKLQHGSTAERV